jgi:DNA-binding CsgD family transcriptional regulator
MVPVGASFVGRLAEVREISVRAALAAAGQRQIVLIGGEPGIGKSALLARAADRLPGFRVVRADCARDRATALAGLNGAGPAALVLDNLDRVHEQFAARLSALLLAPEPAALLVIACLREPWRPDPAARPQAERLRRQMASAADVSWLTLTELSEEETARLLGQRLLERGPLRQGEAGGLVTDEVVLRWHQYTGGHPALLSALLAALPEDGTAADLTAPADLLGLLDPFVASVLRTVAALPAPSRDLLAALAVTDEPRPLAVVGSVAGVDDPFEALEPLLDAGLARWDPADPVGPAAVSYPVYRDLIYRGLPAARREALHARAAAFALGTRAWSHRIAAGPTAEPALARRLEHEAERYYLAGDHKQAGRLLLWSAAVTPGRSERERPLLLAAHWGLTLRAIEWGPRLPGCLAGWPPAAARSLILALIAEAAGRYELARILLAEADDLAGAEGTAGELRADLDLAKTVVHADLGELEPEYQLAAGLLARGGLPAAHRGWAGYYAADARGRQHGPEAALDWLAEPRPGDGPASQAMRLLARGTWRALGGWLRAAADDLERLPRVADRADAEPLIPLARAYLAYVHYQLGDWKAAEHAVALAASTLRGHAIVRLRVPVHAVAACVAAGAGRLEAAAGLVRDARYWQGAGGPADYELYPALAAATVAQAAGNYQAMLAALRPLAADGRRTWHEAWWRPLQVEALIGTGQLAPARQSLARLTGPEGPLARQQGTVAWLEAWLAAASPGGTGARERFEAATARPLAPDDVPLHRARLEHEYGRYLMTGRTRRAAIGRLRRASELYEELGARPYAERCAADLERCGAQARAGRLPAGAAVSASPALSSRERRIAQLAAQGLTNQEISAQVFVSAKTVEYHLGNVFAKLGISSRRQLPAWLGNEPWP